MSIRVSLTLDKIYDLAAKGGTLRRLHGVSKPLVDDKGAAIKGDDGTILMEVVPYKFNPGVRLSLALLIMQLEPYVRVFEELKDQLVKEHQMEAWNRLGEDKSEKAVAAVWNPTSVDYLACKAKVKELTAEVKEIEIGQKFKLSDLKPDENGLSPELLIALQPLVDLSA